MSIFSKHIKFHWKSQDVYKDISFPKDRKIKDLWKMPSWKRESRIMQLNANPLTNHAVNWLNEIPFQTDGSLLVGSLGEKASAGEFQFSVHQRRWYFWKMSERLRVPWDPAMCRSSYCSSQAAVFLPSHIYSLSAEASSRFDNALVVQVSLRFESVSGVSVGQCIPCVWICVLLNLLCHSSHQWLVSI